MELLEVKCRKMLILGDPRDLKERDRNPERRSRGVQDQGPQRSHQQVAQVRFSFRYILITGENCPHKRRHKLKR